MFQRHETRAMVPLLTARYGAALAKVRELFAKAPSIGFTTAETAQASGLDRQVCRVLLRSLAKSGFIERRASGEFIRRSSGPNER